MAEVLGLRSGGGDVGLHGDVDIDVVFGPFGGSAEGVGSSGTLGGAVGFLDFVFVLVHEDEGDGVVGVCFASGVVEPGDLDVAGCVVDDVDSFETGETAYGVAHVFGVDGEVADDGADNGVFEVVGHSLVEGGGAVFCRFETCLEDLHERHDELAYQSELSSLQELCVGFGILARDCLGAHGCFAFPASTDDGTYFAGESSEDTLFDFTHSFSCFLVNN